MDEKKPDTILIVEDDKFLIRMYEVRLSAEGFKIDVAENGDECLEKVQVNPPDAILLDLMMPLVDGFTVLEKLKSDEKTAHIPVIVFSNRSNQDEISRVMDLGAECFLTKVNTPPEEVGRRIHNALRRVKGDEQPFGSYFIEVNWENLDGEQLAKDLGIPVRFEGVQSVKDIILEITPEYAEDEIRIVGRFTRRKRPPN